ncbi:uncharacterized protein LOC129248901 [Anastrepha obliqua]|uniref:uncharacterized protein LOC129248901 n=1 Tax=Anastrepha obliqua TaxID=95512 RepID=UPI0024098625|nr:uncharacterized protein LOC129248901 [Anastrepha obliqua]
MRRINEASDNLNLNSNHTLLECGPARPQTDHTPDTNNYSGDNRQDLLQPGTDSQASHAATSPVVATRQRIKWTSEINEFLLRTYLQITKLETHRTLFRKRLREKFVEKYPQMNVSEQNLSDQLRAIRRHDYITEARREEITQEVARELGSNSGAPASPEQTNNTPQDGSMDAENEGNVPLIIEPVNDNAESIDFESAYNSFQENYAKYRGMPVMSLPHLPKLNTSRKLGKLVDYYNAVVLPETLNEEISLEELIIVIYCVAKTISEIITNKHFENNQHNQKPKHSKSTDKSNKPKWLIRLDKNIEEHRRKIGKITALVGGNTSGRLKRQVLKICKNFNTHSKFENNEEMPKRTLDTLKQKLRTLTTRREKYSMSMKRKQHNRMFESNQKLFLRQLKQTTNVERQTRQASMDEFRSYWSAGRSIWSKPQKYNTSASWIAEVREKYSSIPILGFSAVTPEEVAKVARRLHNWKTPGCDNLHAYWFKKLTCIHDKLAALFTKIITGEEELPNFATLGTTYMIPKCDEINDPSKFRPITCLPVIYKILTSCITNIFYEHIETHNLIAEEQKGCIRASQGCKEQLIIDQVVLGQSKQKNRNLYAAYIDWMKAFDSVPHSWLIEKKLCNAGGQE